MSTNTKESIAGTIEGLEHLANSGIQSVYIDMAITGMRRLLASLEAEPVSVKDDMAYAFHHAISDSSLGSDEVEEIKAGLRAAFANVTAQPAPTVPDKITSANAPEVFEIAAEAERLGLRGAYASYAVGWNACRAAMLQGADGNSPVVSDGWVACSERMPEKNERVLIFINFNCDSVPPSIHDAQFTGSTFRRGGATVNVFPLEDGYGVTHWQPLPSPPAK